MRLAWATRDDAAYQLSDADALQLLERACRLAEAPPTSEYAGPKPLPGYAVSAVWEECYSSPELLKSMPGTGQITTLFGQSGHFKSVLAVDVIMSVGLGLDCHGMRCARRIGGLYVAGEGHAGIRKRMRAWMMARGFDAMSEQPSVYVTSTGADLIGNPAQLRATVEHAAAVLGLPIELVVIDTLAANFGNGDEHHPRDMSLALSGARIAAPEAAVLLVHHVGHGQNERERGSYSLIAAADYRMQASYDDVSKSIELRWHKVKDDERPEPLLFAWKAVPIDWHDDDGNEITSVVLERLDLDRETRQRPTHQLVGAHAEKLRIEEALGPRARFARFHPRR